MQIESAFQIDLLEEFKELNLLCRVNAYNFCQWLRRKSKTKHIIKECETYRPLIDCYRPFNSLINRCNESSINVNDSIKIRCAACFHNKGKVHSATLDACFGAVGKAHQNRYPTTPFTGNEYMLSDLSKETVAKYATEEEPAITSDQKQGCELRSTRGPLQKVGYYDGLNETGLCGSVCMHGVPLFFINIRFGGEKMIFPSTIMDKIVSEKPDWNLLIKYDSMCTFESWRIVT